MIISVVFIFFFMPETKSIPLEVMDRLFKIKPVWRANEIMMKELAQEDEMFRQNLTRDGEKRPEIEEAEDVAK